MVKKSYLLILDLEKYESYQKSQQYHKHKGQKIKIVTKSSKNS